MTNVKQRGSYDLVCILYTWRALYSTLVFPLSHNSVGQERGNNGFIVTSAKRVVSTLSVCLSVCLLVKEKSQLLNKFKL